MPIFCYASPRQPQWAVLFFTHLEAAEKFQVLSNCQSIEQHVVLRTNAKAVTNLIYVGEDTVTVDGGRARSRSEETWGVGEGGGMRKGGREERSNLRAPSYVS